MKKHLWMVLLGAVVMTGCVLYVPYDETGSGRPQSSRYDQGYGNTSHDISYFYDYLSPYGAWVSYPDYGYVWIPRDVGYGWRPYTYGRWAWTDCGWTWVSSFRWGWIPFHYGRWGWDRGLGWFWVPDTVWGPAWVTWRRGGLYVGWAPLPPGAHFIAGVGFRDRDFDIPGPYWVFIDGRNFMSVDIGRYILPYERNLTIINFTVIHTNIYTRGDRVINEGLDLDDMRRATGREIHRLELRSARRPEESRVGDREVVLYRPSIARDQAARPKAVLKRDEAEREVLNESGRRPIRRTGENEESLGLVQERERRLLKKSQEDEIGEIQRKSEENKKATRSIEEKKKIEDEAKAKVSELKKKHNEEKSQLEKRQKEDDTKAKKSRLKKK